MKENKEWCVYLLTNSFNRSSYVGCTNRIRHRLRQHNGELAGGARATSRHGFVDWRVQVRVDHIPSKTDALSLERLWKIESRKTRNRRGHGGVTSSNTLHATCRSDQNPFSDWPVWLRSRQFGLSAALQRWRKKRRLETFHGRVQSCPEI